MAAASPKYSVLLPVYNERENLPLMIAMLDKVFTEKCVAEVLELLSLQEASHSEHHGYPPRDRSAAALTLRSSWLRTAAPTTRTKWPRSCRRRSERQR
jgi:hypothetical protein